MTYLANKKIIIGIIIIGLIAGIYIYKSATAIPPYETATAQIGQIIQEVSVTGNVKPAKTVNLAFEKSGKISRINVAIGDKAKIGQILASLDNSELSAQLLEAQATLKNQQSQLDELKRGTRAEEIQIQETKVNNAKTTLEDAKRNLIDKIQSAYTASDDGIRNKVDPLFSSPRSLNPTLIISANDIQLKIDSENGRITMENILTSWRTSIDKFTINSNFEFYISEAKTNLNQIKSYLNTIAIIVNDYNNTTYKTDVSTARTNVNTANANFVTAEEGYRTAKSNLELEEKNLILKKAGSTAEEISAQEANVDQAKASVQNIQAQISKTMIISPINGIIIKQDAEAGEIVGANINIISIISESKFEIEANISEADIAKVKISDSAKITLDAYGQDVIFEANVSKIDPGETIIEGIATYKTTLQFVADDSRIKSGMTANINILTAKADNTLLIPQRTIINENGKKFVQILNANNEIKKNEIKTGIRGFDGNIEILSGIQEGDKIIISE